MIFLSILILIVAIALPSINKQINPILYIRISSIVIIYAGALSFNALYIQLIGSGIGIYSGLFQLTTVSQLIETLFFIVGALILIAWSSIANLDGGETSKTSPITENKAFKKMISNRTNNAVEYSLIVLFSSLGASFLISSADLISMYLSIELQSFGAKFKQFKDKVLSNSALTKFYCLFKNINSRAHKHTENFILFLIFNFLNIFSYLFYFCVSALFFSYEIGSSLFFVFFGDSLGLVMGDPRTTLLNFYVVGFTFILYFFISYLFSNKLKLSKYFNFKILLYFIIISLIVLGIIATSYLFELPCTATYYCEDIGSTENNSNNNNTANTDSKDKESYKINVSFNANLPKHPVDQAVNFIGNIATNLIGDLGSIAAGTAAAAMVKATQSLPAGQRLLLIGGSAGITKVGTLLGAKGATAISNNLGLEDLIKQSKHSNPDISRIPSPGPEFNINCPIESGDQSIPLLDLLDVINSFNALELVLILMLIYILCLKYLNNFNFIPNLILKYLPRLNTKFQNWSKVFETGKNFNVKFLNIMLVFVIVLLLIFKLMNLYFSSELFSNIDQYVSVYNFFRKK